MTARYPITDGRSHWEVWWLPQGETFPWPEGSFWVQATSWPPPLGLRMRLLLGPGAEPCHGCEVQVLLYNGYTTIGPHTLALRYTDEVDYPEPLVTFGGHCAYQRPDLATTLGQVYAPGEVFTQVLCLENWDAAPRTFHVEATSAQGWAYTYATQAMTAGAPPVPVGSGPFQASVPAPPDAWSPGGLAILAVAHPGVGADLTLRETLYVTATSVLSPSVWAHTVAYAVGPDYRLREAPAVYHARVPLVLRR